jgi:hypothetical protein
MRSARNQDVASEVISLGLLANKLAWYLTGGEELQTLKLGKNMFDQWKAVLEETINFLQCPEGQRIGRKNPVPHFLSRAQYLEQIYTATPEVNKKNLKEMIAYLNAIHDGVESLSQHQQLNSEKQAALLDFTNSIAEQSILEASKYYQETHSRGSNEPLMETIKNG